MPRLKPAHFKTSIHRDEGDAGDTAPSQPASFFSSHFTTYTSLLIVLLLLNLLLPAAGFVHAIASDNHHTYIVAAETGDADECDDTHYPDHVTLISPSEYSIPSDFYHSVIALLADVIPYPLDVSLGLPLVVIPILVPPRIHV